MVETSSNDPVRWLSFTRVIDEKLHGYSHDEDVGQTFADRPNAPVMLAEIHNPFHPSMGLKPGNIIAMAYGWCTETDSWVMWVTTFAGPHQEVSALGREINLNFMFDTYGQLVDFARAMWCEMPYDFLKSWGQKWTGEKWVSTLVGE